MTYSLNYTKILASAVMIAFVISLVFAGTQAFFSDEETSEGNLFTAGALDLRVDSVAHFNSMICTDTDQDGVGDEWQPEEGFDPGPEHYPQPGDPCDGTWEETDLGIEHTFFNFNDLKPGDEGENTISLHVYDNDAWGCFYVENVEDNDNGLTEPESESGDATGGDGEGELGSVLSFDSWLDEGATPGFQCNNPNGVNPEDISGASCPDDPEEGDNILNGGEVLFWTGETIDEASEGPFNQSDVLAAAYVANSCTEATGNTDYENCHGLAEDGRMVGSATYYWGLAWSIPSDTGNEIQTDSIVSDMVFTATQHRNNPDFSCPVITDPVLTLVKDVVGATGGEVDTDWTLSAVGPDSISGVEGDASITSASVAAGDYTLSESGPGGFNELLSCDGGTLVGSVLTLAEGDNVTCTFTNTMQAATLTLEKTVVNDDGGTATEADFTLEATGPVSISGVEGDASVTAASVAVGTYDLSEVAGVAGYTASAWVCVGDGTQDDDDTITLADGESFVCTITNDDDAPII